MLAQIPNFGNNLIDVIKYHFDHTAPKVSEFKRIMCVLSRSNADVEYCMGLPDLVCLLLVHLKEEEAFFVCHKILQKYAFPNWIG